MEPNFTVRRKCATLPLPSCASQISYTRIPPILLQLDEKPGTSRTLANQLLRSGTSIGANLAESKGGQSRADYLSKVSIALKEARETHYWLRLLIATDIIPENQLTPLLDEANQLVAILTTIVKKLKSP